MNSLYLDHNATTPLDPAVRAEMEVWLGETPANASSLHSFGREAQKALTRARERVAALIGARPEEVVFVSGGTEANNLAILGVMGGQRKGRIVTTTFEHQSVLGPCEHVLRTGGSLTLVPVDHDGMVHPDRVVSAVTDDTVLVSVMLANNEVGTVQPVQALSDPLHARGVLLHTDAVQAVGKMRVDVRELEVDLLSFSAHKIYGPKGVGALYVRAGTKLSPVMFGGHQEKGLRPGTENIAAIVGFGKACELARERLDADVSHMSALRSAFEEGLVSTIPDIRINGLGAPRLPNTSNICFDGISGEALVIGLDLMGLAASTGAACSEWDSQPSHVLLAMGRSFTEAKSCVRFSFGREWVDVSQAISMVAEAVKRLRGR